jgi:hypothetical protein
MAKPRAAGRPPEAVARTVRFPESLRAKIAGDAERCGRSFEGQVIALLRRHFGEDVDIAPPPAEILSLAAANVAGLSGAELAKRQRRAARAGVMSGTSSSQPSRRRGAVRS